uniref:Putative secreted protein n=1 Tax=Anopheles darlingi TaxID=43151 RepID=A0A2M4DDW2_ANODA
MCGRVCSQQVILVHVVTVAFSSAWMILRDQEMVEVLLYRHHRAEVIVHAEQRVPARTQVGSVEVFHDFLPHDRQRMVLLAMQVSIEMRQHFRCKICPRITQVLLPVQVNRVLADLGLASKVPLQCRKHPPRSAGS